MSQRFLILILSFILFWPECLAQNLSNDERLRDLVRKYGQAEVTIPYTDRWDADNLSRNLSVFSVKDKLLWISLSPLTIEWFVSLNQDYQIIEIHENKGVISALDLSQAMEWTTYPTYSQYDSIMQNFVTHYPDLCQLDTIGRSINGKLILALKISDNAVDDEEEPEVFYSSSIHGDETGGYILMLRLADFLLKNYDLESRVKNMVDNLEIWINPLANPDGTYRTGNILASPTRYNANGYDLNRNFPDPATPNTVKQKETLDMIRFMRKHRFVISANFHSGAEVVNYPWDKWYTKLHADGSWFNSISRAYADTVHVYSGPAYMNDLTNGVTRGAVWYMINGGRQDFVTYELQGREVTIELDDQDVTPTSQLELLWQNNWRSLIGYLENALYGIHGQVLDVSSGEPVPAKVFISGYDKDSSHVYTDTLTGRFVRLLSPGLWNLTFSASGYLNKTVDDISVALGQKTELSVFMVPVINSVDTTNPETPFIYPNPATTTIRVVLPEKIMGDVNVKIISMSGILVSDYYTEAIKGVPLLLDVRKLPRGTYTAVFTNTITKISYMSRFVVVK